MSSKRNFWD